MCLILFAYQVHPAYRMVLAANRDEFYERPTEQAHFWTDTPGLLAGRDLKGGGTWMGITRQGRFSALTNYRDPTDVRPDAPSRGALVAGFLTEQQAPAAYLERLRPQAALYNGFNLLAGDAEELYYFSNKENQVRRLEPGIYGLSNHLLNTPWPKVERGKAGLSGLIAAPEPDLEALFTLMQTSDPAPDHLLPQTGVGPDWERVLSPLFIQTTGYGTRNTTLVLVGHNGEVTFEERLYAGGSGSQHFRFRLEAQPQG